MPFMIGELLFAQGRYAEAAAAYRRTVHLDASRALVFYQLAFAYKHLGERHRAVYAFEQAMRRAGGSGVVKRRAEWEVEKLTFSIVSEAGLADGNPGDEADTPAGQTREAFGAKDRKITWWARLGGHFVPYSSKVSVRWTDPAGRVVQDEHADRLRKPYISSTLEFDRDGARPAGSWTVEARLDDDVIDRRSVEVLERAVR